MPTKHFCDRCGREVSRPFGTVHITSGAFTDLAWDMVCHPCIDAITTLLRPKKPSEAQEDSQ